MIFDCIIVGAGPAGGTAAYHLAKRGRSVCILEKAPLPRYKPCGGGVSPVVQDWFDFDLSPAISVKIESVRCTWKKEKPVEIDIRPGAIWMVRRNIFDHFLVQQAVQQGATLRDQTPAEGIEWLGHCWQVNTPEDCIQGKYLIAADGSKGPLARWLGFKHRKHFAGAALEVEVPREHLHHPHAEIEFGLLNHGYLWNFPKADGYSMGIWKFSRGQSGNLRAVLKDYATEFEIENILNYHQWVHPIYLWNGNQKLHTQNALLAGEAACVVDPFTAEGIRPSIWSGLKASEAIDRALGGDLNALEDYTHILAQTWGSEMALAKRIAQGFYQFTHLGYKVGIEQGTSGRTFLKIFSGELKYADVIESALKKFNLFSH